MAGGLFSKTASSTRLFLLTALAAKRPAFRNGLRSGERLPRLPPSGCGLRWPPPPRGPMVPDSVSQTPQRLWIVRHGESAGNLALLAAEAGGQHLIDVSARDADVPLSALGVRQAQALGRWFAAQPADQHPTVVLTSPYQRALNTAQILLETPGLGGIRLIPDERLREKEFGMLNRMTAAGILAKLPEQAELRKTLGKFYYRPPGGESWCDIILRLRSVWSTLREEHAGARVLLVCHSVVTFCFRYLLEALTEEEILAIDKASDVANCAVTSYVPAAELGPGRMRLVTFNFVAPLTEAGERVTREPDAPLAK